LLLAARAGSFAARSPFAARAPGSAGPWSGPAGGGCRLVAVAAPEGREGDGGERQSEAYEARSEGTTKGHNDLHESAGSALNNIKETRSQIEAQALV
jgi:hypothetical protein